MQADQLLGKHSQVDPKFQTETLVTRMTGESLRNVTSEVTLGLDESGQRSLPMVLRMLNWLLFHTLARYPGLLVQARALAYRL